MHGQHAPVKSRTNEGEVSSSVVSALVCSFAATSWQNTKRRITTICTTSVSAVPSSSWWRHCSRIFMTLDHRITVSSSRRWSPQRTVNNNSPKEEIAHDTQPESTWWKRQYCPWMHLQDGIPIQRWCMVHMKPERENGINRATDVGEHSDPELGWHVTWSTTKVIPPCTGASFLRIVALTEEGAISSMPQLNWSALRNMFETIMIWLLQAGRKQLIWQPLLLFLAHPLLRANKSPSTSRRHSLQLLQNPQLPWLKQARLDPDLGIKLQVSFLIYSRLLEKAPSAKTAEIPAAASYFQHFSFVHGWLFFPPKVLGFHDARGWAVTESCMRVSSS